MQRDAKGSVRINTEKKLKNLKSKPVKNWENKNFEKEDLANVSKKVKGERELRIGG